GLRTLALADVPQEGLDVLRLAGRVADGRRLLPHPDDPAVACEQPVLGAARRPVLRLLELGEKALPVVRVHVPGIDVEAGLPVTCPVARQLLAPGAHVERVAVG